LVNNFHQNKEKMTKIESGSASLSEVNASVDVRGKKTFWRKLLAFAGPAYLVSVGYMDPGNWATDIAGGSQFGYKLIWVLLMSNLIAQLLQALCIRLGVVRGRDLAQASREMYPPAVNMFLYILAEIAIAACDLAEVLGMAIGLQLLFHIPLMWGVVICVLDTFLLLFLMNYGIRKLEVFIIGLISIIGMAFFAQMIFAKPDITEIAGGFIPSIPNNTALYIAIGIIGATVMPHNLYLHSSLVQTRKFERTSTEIKKAIRFNLIDSTIALNLAFFVNAAILILAGTVFFKHGLYEVADIQDAHKLLEPLTGAALAPVLFAIALLCSGQSSTITGTLAGQIVMEGYLNIRIQPWIRRLLTRVIAIVPALLVINYMGESATGELLVLSQVILSLQLGFAIIPLIHFVSDADKMKEFVIKPYIKVLAWVSAVIIVSLNVKLVSEQLLSWMQSFPDAFWLNFIVLPIAIFSGLILIYITFLPLFKTRKKIEAIVPHGGFKAITDIHSPAYKRIAIALDFSDSDSITINHALAQGGKDSEYLLIHVTETPGALMFGKDTRDMEAEIDLRNIEQYVINLKSLGYNCKGELGYGNPKVAIVQKSEEFNADILVMGAHGHRMLKDIIFGTTVDSVRHALKIPVLIVR
jgi:manganese transport protein